MPSSCLRFRLESRQEDCSKPRTKETIIIITIIIMERDIPKVMLLGYILVGKWEKGD